MSARLRSWTAAALLVWPVTAAGQVSEFSRFEFYGGYFGAGVSVIILAVLGLVLDDSLTRLNALKQSISFVTNVAAATFFLFSGQVVWPAALVMAVGALVAVGGSGVAVGRGAAVG